MAWTSTRTEQLFEKAYDKSKDVVGTVKDESRALYEEARHWVPKHPTAVAVSATAAVSVGLLGYALGRRRRRAERGPLAAALARTPLARAPEFDFSPFFRILKIWMLFRIATRD